MTKSINIDEKFSKFSQHWRPKIVAQLNGQDAKRLQSVWETDCSVAPEQDSVQDDVLLWKIISMQGVKNNGDAEVEATYDAPLGEWV